MADNSPRILRQEPKKNPSPLLDLDVSRLRSAVSSAEQGRLEGLARLAAMVSSESRVSAVLESRVGGLISLPIEFEHSDPGVLSAWEEDYYSIVLDGEQKSLHKDYILLGYGLGRINWIQGPSGRWLPQLIRWDPTHLICDPQTGVWKTKVIDRGNEVEVEVSALPEQWVMLSASRFNPWRHGKTEGLARNILIKNQALKVWAMAQQAFGLGQKILTPTLNANGNTILSLDEIKAHVEGINALGIDSTIYIPEGLSYEVKGNSSIQYQSFETLINSANTDIAISVLGQNLTTQVNDAGARASALVHERVAQDRLRDDSSAFSSLIHDQIASLWVRYNYPGVTESPWSTRVVDAPTPALVQMLSQSVGPEKFAQEVDTAKLFRQMGLPLRGK